MDPEHGVPEHHPGTRLLKDETLIQFLKSLNMKDYIVSVSYDSTASNTVSHSCAAL
jgi:hypothetical protein